MFIIIFLIYDFEVTFIFFSFIFILINISMRPATKRTILLYINLSNIKAVILVTLKLFRKLFITIFDINPIANTNIPDTIVTFPNLFTKSFLFSTKKYNIIVNYNDITHCHIINIYI